MSVGTAIRKTRQVSQEVLAKKCNVSRELIAAIETNRRRLPQDISPMLARFIDHGNLYSVLQREASGVGPIYLNNIDDHPLACVMKMLEEYREAIDITMEIVPILIRGPGRATEEDLRKLEEWGLECCEAATARENAQSRVFKKFGLSLAELWDQHEQELIEKGYLKKEKTASKAAM
ncbi:MAG: helix-turn-helix transcriptional regulator [Dehalobacter sp.]|nr:helix-turn-helix transcriptional regulator [Dehalobacter sp.]